MLLRIIILLVLILVLPDAYIYLLYIRKWTTSKAKRLLWFLPAALLFIAMIIIICTNDMKPDHQVWASTFMLVCLLMFAPKALFAVFDGIGHIVKNHIFRRCFRIIGMTLAMFSAFLICYGYFIGRHQYVVHQQTFYFSDLPQAFDGYRIAQFSDFHAGTFRDGNENDVKTIVNLINNQRCNAIVFTGDIVNHQSTELDGMKRDLKHLSAPDGVYSIMGNHDYSMYIKYDNEQEREADVEEIHRKERSYGWNLLLNENRVIRHGRDSIAIVGVENDGLPPWPSLGDLPKATEGLRKGTFCVLLSHDPTHWRRSVVPDTDIQLTLSGHTHAGQFKVMGWSPVSLKYDEWSGAYCEGTQILNISDGIGAVLFPFRFGAWPEINVITLKKRQHTSSSRQ